MENTRKPLRKILEEERKITSLGLPTIEQDFLLTLFLQIFSTNWLRHHLVFKGGTALKKCYFGKYRFSEDLDFTALSTTPRGPRLENAIKLICEECEKFIQEQANVQLTCTRYVEKDPHPEKQEAFVIRGQFPWQREPLAKIMVEITFSESLLLPLTEQAILHQYPILDHGKIACYSLEEIVLEKLRAILQHTKKLHERDWSRSRARDYYDLWHIFRKEKISIDFYLLEKKCNPKNVGFTSIDDFFDPKMIQHVERTWDKWLSPLVHDLPIYETVLTNLREELFTQHEMLINS